MHQYPQTHKGDEKSLLANLAAISWNIYRFIIDIE